MAYRTSLDLVPLQWTEQSKHICDWWPREIQFPVDLTGAVPNLDLQPIDRRCWSTRFMGIRPYVIELTERGVYVVIYAGFSALQEFPTLSEAQDHVFEGLLGTVKELVISGAQAIDAGHASHGLADPVIDDPAETTIKSHGGHSYEARDLKKKKGNEWPP